jgi:hypothetical protein
MEMNKGKKVGKKSLEPIHWQSTVLVKSFMPLVSPRVARFFPTQYTKTGKRYQIATKITKWPKNVPNGCNTVKIAKECTKTFQFQSPPKFTQIGIFGLKTNHLATLVSPAIATCTSATLALC